MKKGVRGTKYASRNPLTPGGQAICARLRAEIVRAGWSKTALAAGVERTALHRAFPAKPSQHNPHFSTIAAVADALGLDLVIARRPLD